MTGRDRTRYRDREHAGRVLAAELDRFVGRSDLVVLALPRGGVPVAAPVAQRLEATLGVLVVRKIGVPGRPELAMGAVASAAGRLTVVTNDAVVRSVGVSAEAFRTVADRETAEVGRRVQALGGDQLSTENRTVIVVDDGLATGSTMLAAVTALRRGQPAAIVVAVPVGAEQAVQHLERVADAVVCPWRPEPFTAVGVAYRDFTQVDDDEVRSLLATFAG